MPERSWCRIIVESRLIKPDTILAFNTFSLFSTGADPNINTFSLFSTGADPNVKDNHGNVAIIVASTEGFDEIVESLLDYGSNPNLCNDSGNAALHFLAMKNHYRG